VSGASAPVAEVAHFKQNGESLSDSPSFVVPRVCRLSPSAGDVVPPGLSPPRRVRPTSRSPVPQNWCVASHFVSLEPEGGVE